MRDPFDTSGWNFNRPAEPFREPKIQALAKQREASRYPIERAREECLRLGSHTWGEGDFKYVCLRCGEGYPTNKEK